MPAASTTSCLIALGSNLGDRGSTLNRAVGLIAAHPEIEVEVVSRWHETQPVGGPEGQPAFLNGAARLASALSPRDLWSELQRIEQTLGRQRAVRWDARTLDLDLLLYGRLCVRSPELTIPHPRMSYRRFVLEPAAEVAAAMRHPEIGWTIHQLLEHLNRAPPYVAICGYPRSARRILAERLAGSIGGRMIRDPAETDAQAGRSGSLTPAAAIRFLRQRAELLMLDDDPGEQAPGTSSNWCVSDFWLEDIVPLIDEGGQRPDRPRQREAVLNELAGYRQSTMRPKLLIYLEPDAAAAGSADEVRAGARFELASRRHRLGQILARGGHGPLLRLKWLPMEEALLESAAAVEAMS